MSLTNPNTPVSQKDLQDFYHRILPYLGGMPEMLANKFSKGDLYSTDEKMIGQWIDGKPLYQKTITMNFSNDTNESQSDIISENMETAFIVEAFSVNNDGYTCPIPMLSASTTLATTRIYYKDCRVYLHSTWTVYAGKPAIITIRYTKTTDSPVAIGIDTDYSTEEKIVGTWIDGKPLYQKTIVITNTALGATTEVNHNIENVSKIIDYKAVMISSSSNSFVVPNFINTSSIAIGIEAVNATRIKFHTLGYTASEYESINATIQYTKTTD